MLLWTSELKRLGFRDRGNRYWRCDRGYGLVDTAHISLYLWTEHARMGSGGRYEFAEFHVTFEVPRHNLHFYYHESRVGRWQAAGHTSSAEIARLGLDVAELKTLADGIAGSFVESLGGLLQERSAKGAQGI